MTSIHTGPPSTTFRRQLSRPSAGKAKDVLAALLTVLLLIIGPTTARADEVVATIPVGAVPVSAAISPDGGTVYVSNSSSSSISVIDTASNTVVHTIATPALPAGVAVTPNGAQLWVALSDANRVAVYDTATLILHTGFPQNPIPVGLGPQNIAFRAGGGQAFVSNSGSNTVSAIRVDSGTVTYTVNVGTHPIGIANAFNPATGVNTIFVANYGSNTVSRFNPPLGPAVIMPWTLAVGTQPYGVAATPDGTEVYVTNSGSDNMSRVDVGSATVIDTITTGAGPKGVVVINGSPGVRVYVASEGSNKVTEIGPKGLIISNIQLYTRSHPTGIAALPNGNRLYVTNSGTNTVSVISTD